MSKAVAQAVFQTITIIHKVLMPGCHDVKCTNWEFSKEVKGLEIALGKLVPMTLKFPFEITFLLTLTQRSRVSTLLVSFQSSTQPLWDLLAL